MLGAKATGKEAFELIGELPHGIASRVCAHLSQRARTAHHLPGYDCSDAGNRPSIRYCCGNPVKFIVHLLNGLLLRSVFKPQVKKLRCRAGD